MTFINRYRVNSFPYICILDPRTGGEVWSWERNARKGVAAHSKAASSNVQHIEVQRLLEVLIEFINEKPHPEDVGISVSKESSQPSSSTSTQSDPLGAANDEEEQLQRALLISAEEMTSQSSEKSAASMTVTESIRKGDSKLIRATTMPAPFVHPTPAAISGLARAATLPVQPMKSLRGFAVSDFAEAGSAADATDEGRCLLVPLKIQLPAPSVPILLQVSSEYRICDLLHDVASRLRLTNCAPAARFEIAYGHPLRRLTPEAVSGTDELRRFLSAVGIIGGERLRVEMVNDLL